MKKGRFRGKFRKIIYGCPTDQLYFVSCSECIYYRDKCLNFSLYLPCECYIGVCAYKE